VSELGKTTLVNELVVLTGYHRKSILRALKRAVTGTDVEASEGRSDKHYRCRYGPELLEALMPLQAASDRLCGKRVQA
jgi:hypothetical protein